MNVVLGKRKPSNALSAPERSALRALVAEPKFELIPLASAMEHAAHLPARATVTVTASPGRGLEATLDLCERLRDHGHEAIPHLSAHMVRDAAHLADLLQRCAGSGLERAFVVGGDAKDPGAYPDGLSLLRAIHETGHPFAEIGVPAYPEGHPNISEARLVEVLVEKQRYAAYMATQMCFNPDAIMAWIARMRAAGVELPVNLGTPGVADLKKLMAVSAKIGVADSARYLMKNRRMVGKLLSPGSFGPDALLEGMAPSMCDPTAAVVALHLFTFNQVEATVAWQERMLAELGRDLG